VIGLPKTIIVKSTHNGGRERSLRNSDTIPRKALAKLILNNWARAAGFGAVLFAAIVCTFIWAISYPPFPGCGTLVESYQSDSNPKNKGGEVEVRPTNSIAPPPKANGALNTTCEDYWKGKETFEKAANDRSAAIAAWALVFVTATLVFVTGGLWVFTGLLWLSTSRAIQGEEKAANAMAELAKSSKDSSERQLRAYVFIENAWVREGKQPLTWRVEYRIKNFGSTPASNVIVTDVAAMSKDGGPPALTDRTPYGALAPGGDFIDTTSADYDWPVDYTTRANQSIWLAGRIDYRDMTNKARWTTFCFETPADLPDGEEMDVHENGNDYY
jgi:hypothetical protein